MALRSVIDIDLNDSKFQNFKRLYDQYQRALRGDKTAWQQVNNAIDGSRRSFEAMVNLQIAQMGRTKIMAEAQKEAERRTRTIADSWRDISRSTKETAANIGSITLSVLKWSAITGLFTGLLGAGGLFGISRLAENTAASRRSALGLGVSQGQASSFGLNFQRFVDPAALLSAISGAQHDVTSRGYVGLLAAGLSPNFLQGNNAAGVGAELLKRIPHLFGGTPSHLIGARLKSLGLDEFLSQQDVTRYLGSSQSERDQQHRKYGGDVGRLGLDPGTSLAWQDFATQMARAGASIENTFVKTLVGLAKPLETLSGAIERTIEVLLGNDKLKTWVDGFGAAIESFAKQVMTDEFQNGVRQFVSGVAAMGGIIFKFVSFFGGGSTGAAAAPKAGGATWGDALNSLGAPGAGLIGLLPDSKPIVELLLGRPTWGTPGAKSVNNPGNLRPPGASSGYMQYLHPDDGVVAMAKQLQLYASRDNIRTISGIIDKYAPSSENDTAGYIGTVARRTGYGPNERLDLNDPQVLARVLEAMIKVESPNRNYNQKTIVEILNNTGGSAIVSTSQVAQ